MDALPISVIENLVLEACSLVETEHSPIEDDEVPAILLQCVLGSRVRYEITRAYVTSVTSKLGNGWQDESTEVLQIEIRQILTSQQSGRYRYPFPDRGTRLAVGSLLWLRNWGLHALRRQVFVSPPRETRRLALKCPGLGPKQASLFVRSFRPDSYLAVLDSHLLRYLNDRLPSLGKTDPPRGIDDYERLENFFLDYARWLEEDPTTLDVAIWHVMRALKEVA